MPATAPPNSPSRATTFLKEHRLAALITLGALIIIALIIVVIFTTSSDNDGVEGTDSRNFEAAQQKDAEALKNYKISNFLPITSKDPAYTISYRLDQDPAGNYSFAITLNAFSASARDAMVKRLLSENFGGEDPLNYQIIIENYRNPFTGFSLTDLNQGTLPANLEKTSLYKFGDSPYTVQTYTHTLYDDSKNTYRAVLENGELKTIPQLIFTYADLPYLDHTTVKSLNALE